MLKTDPVSKKKKTPAIPVDIRLFKAYIDVKNYLVLSSIWGNFDWIAVFIVR